MNVENINEHNLHLLVDGQLDAVTLQALQEKIDTSPELQQKLRNIIELKELTSLAYLQEQPALVKTVARPATINRPSFAAIAAILILMIGLTFGWMGHQYLQGDKIQVASVTPPSPTFTPDFQQSLQFELQNERKYMMHLDSDNPAKFQKALIETRTLLRSYAESGLPVEFEILLNQRAVTLLKPQHAKEINKIKILIKQYDNIQLYACSKSIKLFLDQEQISPDINLFHADRVVEEMIPERIEQGWVYIKA